jgi:hypothetical protein
MNNNNEIFEALRELEEAETGTSKYRRCRKTVELYSYKWLREQEEQLKIATAAFKDILECGNTGEDASDMRRIADWAFAEMGG